MASSAASAARTSPSASSTAAAPSRGRAVVSALNFTVAGAFVTETETFAKAVLPLAADTLAADAMSADTLAAEATP